MRNPLEIKIFMHYSFGNKGYSIWDLLADGMENFEDPLPYQI